MENNNNSLNDIEEADDFLGLEDKENINNYPRYSNEWYNSLGLEDTRYYGVFTKGKGKNRHILVDPERYQKEFKISEEMKKIMDARKNIMGNGKPMFFKPARKFIDDYDVNIVMREFCRIKREWNDTQKPLIKWFLSQIKGTVFNHMDDDNLRSGIVDFDEAIVNARIKTSISESYAEFKREQLFYSLYAQYFHQLAAQIDAIFIRTLIRNGYEEDKDNPDHFNRSVFSAFKGCSQEKLTEQEGYKEYDKLYLVWHLLKHNSNSAYKRVKDNYPEVFKENVKYKQGELACYIIDFSDELIDSILDGVKKYLIGYCRIVFDEDFPEALWNSEEHFIAMANASIDEERDPLALGYEFY
jgi:hypothetical protein